MSPQTARETANTLGWFVVAAAIGVAPTFMAGATIFAWGAGALVLIYSWIVLALVSGAGIALIFKSIWGFPLLYIAAISATIVPGVRLLPFVQRIVPPGPTAEYYLMAANAVALAIAAWCHWSIAQEQEPAKARRHGTGILAVLAIFAGGLIFWKTGIRSDQGEVARVTDLPFVGSLLSPLESSQPVAFLSHELPRRQSGTIIFHGKSSEENIKKFAGAYQLTLMTNVEAKLKFLPIIKSWKLDEERFPLLNGPNDLCYIGRIPTNGLMVFQLCHRPSDGRFTAMAMGSPRALRGSKASEQLPQPEQ